MVRLIQTEFFKVRKRRMPWVLLGIMIVLMALFQFGMYGGYRSLESISEDRPVQAQGHQEALDQIGNLLSLPRATEGIFSMFQSAGGFLLVILVGSVVGAEYAWGTVRTSIIRGMGRDRYLLSKLATLLLLTLAGLIITFVFGFIFAVGTTLLLEGSIDWGFLGGLYIPRVLAMFGRTWFVLAVPISMAAMVAVLARSSAVAIGVGIAYPIIESIVVSILAGIAGWGETVREYSIGYNISAVMALNAMGGRYTSTGINLGNVPGGLVPAFWRTASLLVGYGLAFLVVAFYSFRKRDLTT
jgi:ABC-type transport system involved in multi-copper enzyme maturation permease subunit